MNLLSETQSFTFLLAMLQNLFYSFVVVVTVVSKSCLTFCDPLRCTLQGSSVHGSSQTKILEGIGISFSKGSSDSRIKPTCPVLQAVSLALSHMGSLC